MDNYAKNIEIYAQLSGDAEVDDNDDYIDEMSVFEKSSEVILSELSANLLYEPTFNLTFSLHTVTNRRG